MELGGGDAPGGSDVLGGLVDHLTVLKGPAGGECGARAGSLGLDRHIESVAGSKGVGLFVDGLVCGDAPTDVDVGDLHSGL
jgi:hypothetical protein